MDIREARYSCSLRSKKKFQDKIRLKRCEKRVMSERRESEALYVKENEMVAEN